MQVKKHTKNNGGRPKKVSPRERLLGVRCNTEEKEQIIRNASQVNLTPSEYLRHLGIHQKIEKKITILPKEVLIFCAVRIRTMIDNSNIIFSPDQPIPGEADQGKNYEGCSFSRRTS